MTECANLEKSNKSGKKLTLNVDFEIEESSSDKDLKTPFAPRTRINPYINNHHILREKYNNGEISGKEYERLKKIITTDEIKAILNSLSKQLKIEGKKLL